MLDYRKDYRSLPFDHSRTTETVHDERLIRAGLTEHVSQQREKHNGGEDTETNNNKVAVRHRNFFRGEPGKLAGGHCRVAAPQTAKLVMDPDRARRAHRRFL